MQLFMRARNHSSVPFVITNVQERGNLTKHIASVHEGKKPLSCAICDYICSQKSTLTLHIESVHEGKKPFKCSICDYNFSKVDHMMLCQNHLKRSEMSKTYQPVEVYIENQVIFCLV